MVKALRKILFITRFFTFVSHNCEIFFYFKSLSLSELLVDKSFSIPVTVFKILLLHDDI